MAGFIVSDGNPSVASAAGAAAIVYCDGFGGDLDMRIALVVLGALFIVIGVVWFLQGINVLPGSFMTGQVRWAVYGGVCAAIGVGLLWRANRLR